MSRHGLVRCSALGLIVGGLSNAPAIACPWNGCGTDSYNSARADAYADAYYAPLYAYAPLAYGYGQLAYGYGPPVYGYARPVYNSKRMVRRYGPSTYATKPAR